MDLTTKVRERLCADGGEWTTESVQAAFPGARVVFALEWLSGIGLLVSPSPGTWQAVDRWSRPIPSGARLKPPAHDPEATPGKDKGALGPGAMPSHPMSEGSKRIASMRRARRDRRMPGVIADLRGGATWKQAMVNAGWKPTTGMKWFPEWRVRIDAAKAEAVSRLQS